MEAGLALAKYILYRGRMKNPLDTAIELAGNQSLLANMYGIKPQAVQQWKFIPESRALETETLFKGKVSARAILEYASSAKSAA